MVVPTTNQNEHIVVLRFPIRQHCDEVAILHNGGTKPDHEVIVDDVKLRNGSDENEINLMQVPGKKRSSSLRPEGTKMCLSRFSNRFPG